MNRPADPTPAQQAHDVHEALTTWFTRAVRRRLGLLLALSVLLPWSIAMVAHSVVQPGLYRQAERTERMIDYMATGAMLFLLSMTLTWLIGCWVVAVMKGPRYDGDAFPPGSHCPDPADDAARIRRPPRD